MSVPPGRGGDEPLVSQTLRAAYERYQAAEGGRDREELVTSRLALCLALMETGWTPPEQVREQMRRDEKTLRRLRDSDSGEGGDVLDLPVPRWRELRHVVEAS